MKIINLILAFVLLTVTATAQIPDSVKSKVGIYKNFQEFKDRKPSITKAFAIDTLKYYENTDSAITEYTYHFLDSSQNVYHWFFLFDGNNLFYDNGNGVISPVNGMGSFPFWIQIPDDNGGIRTGYLEAEGLRILDKLISKPKAQIWYINREGQFSKAVPYTFAKFLKPESDLYKQLIRENKFKVKDYIRYLKLLNERYPF